MEACSVHHCCIVPRVVPEGENAEELSAAQNRGRRGCTIDCPAFRVSVAQVEACGSRTFHFPIIFLIFPARSFPISDSAALSTRWMESSTSSLPLQCSRTTLASTLPRILFRT